MGKKNKKGNSNKAKGENNGSSEQPSKEESISDVEQNTESSNEKQVDDVNASKETDDVNGSKDTTETTMEAVDNVQNVQTKELESLVAKQKEEIDRLKEQEKLNKSDSSESEQVKLLQERLEAAEQAKEESDDAYEELLSKVSHIRSTLGEKLKADSQELARCKEQLEQYQAKDKERDNTIETLQRELITSTKDQDKLSHELTSLRKEYEAEYNKWQKEKESFVKEKRKLMDSVDNEKQLVKDLEIALKEESTSHQGFSSKISELEEQISTQASYAEQFRQQRDDSRNKVEQLEKALEQKSLEFSSKFTQLEETNQDAEAKVEKAQQELQDKVHQLEEVQKEVERLKPFEGECKDKSLQLGKVRHEAVILNEHLTKALRMIKKDSEGETVDKEIISNLILSFVTIPRGDTKKFEVLQILSSILAWDEDQKVHAGLSRSSIVAGSGSAAGGSGGAAGGAASPKRSFSSNNLSNEEASSGGFMGRFAEFLERESSKR